MKQLITILIIAWIVLLGLIGFTNVFDYKYKYIRLRSGQEFIDCSVRFVNRNTGIVINDKEYKYLEVDSISPH